MRTREPKLIRSEVSRTCVRGVRGYQLMDPRPKLNGDERISNEQAWDEWDGWWPHPESQLKSACLLFDT